MNCQTKDHFSCKEWILAGIPAIGVMVFALVLFVYWKLLFQSTSSPEMEKWKVLWASTVVTLDFALILSLFISGFMIYTFFPRSLTQSPKRKFLIIFIVVVTLIVYAVIAYLWLCEFGGSATDTLLDALYCEFKNLPYLVCANNVMAGLAVTLLFYASSVMTLGIDQSNLHEVKERLFFYRISIVVAAVLLASGIFEVFTLSHWGAAKASNKSGLASSVPLAAGIIFSCLMATIFLPPATRLHGRILTLISESAKYSRDFDREKWMIKNEIGTLPLQAIASYISVLIPAVTGLITNFFPS